jgi:hypothetical protein
VNRRVGCRAEVGRDEDSAEHVASCELIADSCSSVRTNRLIAKPPSV